jgi:hypothetical protein
MRLAIAILALACGTARAKDNARGFVLFGDLKPAVGSWARYEFVSGEGKKAETMKYKVAIVGKEGKNLWVEQLVEETKKGKKRRDDPVSMKMLVGKDGAKKVYIKTPDGIMDMSNMPGFSAPKKGPGEEKMKKAGKESVTVPAGSFKAEKYTYEDADGQSTVWIAPGVGPYGVVKQENPDGHMALLEHGKDAQSEFGDVSHAEKMPDMSGMGMNPGQGIPDMQEMMRKAMQQQKQGGGE